MYYKHLNLPKPIESMDSIKKLLDTKLKLPGNRYKLAVLDFHPYLTEEFLYAMKSYNLVPTVMIIFGHQNDPEKNKIQPNVHTDLYLENNTWLKVPCAVNFEVTDTIGEFKWWNIYGAREVLPVLQPDNMNVNYLHSNGARYEPLRGRPYDLIETGVISQKTPILIKTNAPHSLTYDKGYDSRISVSFRFDKEIVKSFEYAESLFR